MVRRRVVVGSYLLAWLVGALPMDYRWGDSGRAFARWWLFVRERMVRRKQQFRSWYLVGCRCAQWGWAQYLPGSGLVDQCAGRSLRCAAHNRIALQLRRSDC